MAFPNVNVSADLLSAAAALVDKVKTYQAARSNADQAHADADQAQAAAQLAEAKATTAEAAADQARGDVLTAADELDKLLSTFRPASPPTPPAAASTAAGKPPA